LSWKLSKRLVSQNDPKRPRDPNLAKSLIDIADGREAGPQSNARRTGKRTRLQWVGETGGKARADSVTAERRSKIAKNAAGKRWNKTLQAVEELRSEPLLMTASSLLIVEGGSVDDRPVAMRRGPAVSSGRLRQ
jgi:hypothetical protein